MEEAKRMKPGKHMMHKDEPWRVLNNKIVVTGTHSHTHNKLDIQNLFSGQKITITLPPHERIEEVDIIRKMGQCISKTTSTAQIMDPVTYETFDAKVDKDIMAKLAEGDQVTYVDFQGNRKILEVRNK